MEHMCPLIDYCIKTLWFSCSQMLLYYLVFKSFDLERT